MNVRRVVFLLGVGVIALSSILLPPPSASPYPFFVAGNYLASQGRLDLADTSLPSSPPSSAELGELVHVQLLHRHGDRAPVHVNPKDMPLWRDRIGLRPGQLSKIGIAQLGALGRHLRKAYVMEGFLPPVPGTSVQTRSTDVDRCLQSIHALLDELYPQSLIPVHTVPEPSEKLLQATDKCPSYLLTYRSILREMDERVTRELTKLPHPPSGESSTEHEREERGPTFDMVKYLAKSSGWETALQPANLMSIVTDNLTCLKAHGLPIPPLLHHSFDLVRNYTKALLFNKYSTFHVRRAWAQKSGTPFTLPDDKEPGSGMDPRGAVGAVLAKHFVHHWTNLLKAIKDAPPVTPPSPITTKRRHLLTIDDDEQLEDHLQTNGDADDGVDDDDDSSFASSSRHLLATPTPSTDPTSRLPRLRAPQPGSLRSKSGGVTLPMRAPSLSDPPEEPTPDGVVPLPPSAPPVESDVPTPMAPKKHLSRRERWKRHQMQLLAQQKLMVYSAHDTTILALFEALGLILTPQSQYLLPPYAASITLELRRRLSSSHSDNPDAPMDGYYVNALYGFPLTAAGTTGTENGVGIWEYHRHPLAIRCLTRAQAIAMESDESQDKWQIEKQWQCPLSDFRRFIRFISRGATTTKTGLPTHEGAYSPDDGCCEKLSSFYTLGCDRRTANATELEDECLAFRTRCPNACEPGEKLDPLTLVCEPACNTINNVGEGGIVLDSSQSTIPSGRVLTIPDTTGLSPSPLQAHRDWIFLAFSITCLAIGLCACYRAERARKDIRGVYQEVAIGVGDESGPSDDDTLLLPGHSSTSINHSLMSKHAKQRATPLNL